MCSADKEGTFSLLLTSVDVNYKSESVQRSSKRQNEPSKSW